MADEYESEPEESGGEEPTKMNIDEDEDEDNDSDMENQPEPHPTATPMVGETEDNLDGFIVNSEEEEMEDDRSHRRKRKRKKKRKKHRDQPKITEDTLRMLAESRGETYRPDIDIDQGLSDGDDDSDQSDDSDGGGLRRKLTKLISNSFKNLHHTPLNLHI